jgi:hypothetical protein
VLLDFWVWNGFLLRFWLERFMMMMVVVVEMVTDELLRCLVFGSSDILVGFCSEMLVTER